MEIFLMRGYSAASTLSSFGVPATLNHRWQASAIFAPQNRAKVESALREELAAAGALRLQVNLDDEHVAGALRFGLEAAHWAAA